MKSEIPNIDYEMYIKIVSRPGSPLKMCKIHNGFYKYMKLYVPDSPHSKVIIISQKIGHEDVYVFKPELGVFGKKIGQQIAQNPNWGKDFIKRTYEDCEALKSISKDFSENDLKPYSNEDLSVTFLKYMDMFEKWSPSTYVAILLDRALEGRITQMLQEHMEPFDVEVLRRLLISEKILPIVKMREDILHSAIQVKEGGDIKEYVKDLLKSYAWIPVQDYFQSPYSNDFFMKEIEEAVKYDPTMVLRNLREKREAGLERLRVTEESLNLNDEEKRILSFMRELLYLRTFRTDAMRIAIYNAIPFVEEVGKRFGLNNEEVSCLLPSELTKLLDGKEINVKEIKNRKNGFLYVYIDGKPHISINNNDIKDAKQILERVETNEIKGTSVYPGKVKGIAKVVLSVEDLEKIKKGDILVAKVTSPDYTIVFSKVKAIITDEGGLTSHAAIVSRELRIPCIVGTKMATKILKDGMTIEMDAEKGTVQILV